MDEMKKELMNLKKEEPDVFPDTHCGRYMRFLWDLMEKPDTSFAAQVRFQTCDFSKHQLYIRFAFRLSVLFPSLSLLSQQLA